jgi:hypothetical protein
VVTVVVVGEPWLEDEWVVVLPVQVPLLLEVQLFVVVVVVGVATVVVCVCVGTLL